MAVSLVAPDELKWLRAIEKIIGQKIDAIGDVPQEIHKAKQRRRPQGGKPRNASGGKPGAPKQGRPQRNRRNKPNSNNRGGSKPARNKSAA